MIRNRIFRCLLAAALLLGLACGCSAQTSKEEPEQDVMVICAELRDYRNVMKGVNYYSVRYYPNAQFEMLWLPDPQVDPEGREQLIRQLRTQIMAGKGPDVFLLRGTDSLLNPSDSSEYLFEDLHKAQTAGLFYDLTTLLSDQDFAELIPALAEYKTNGEPLYLLPLGYLPLTVSYTSGTPDSFTQAAQSTSPLLDYLPALLNQAGDTYASELSGLARALPLAGGTDDLSETIDREDFLALLRLQKQLMQTGAAAQPGIASLKESLTSGEPLCWTGLPLYDPFLEQASLLAAQNSEPYFSAVPNLEGGVTAMATSYVGVRANSTHLDQARDLIQILLSEHIQTWETNFPNPGYRELSSADQGLPVCKTALAAMLRDRNRYGPSGGFVWGEISDATIARYEDFQNSVTHITLVDRRFERYLAICEPYFAGTQSEELTLEALQREFVIYADE